MKIFSAEQMRAWDAYTIRHEPVLSIDLMERAAGRCADWLLAHFGQETGFMVFCGMGNNGGDGLAIARMLLAAGRRAGVVILESRRQGSPDFLENLKRLQAASGAIFLLAAGDAIPDVPAGAVVVDALFGTGLNTPLSGHAARLVEHLNGLPNTRVAIDLPSGLFADRSAVGNPVLLATHTLTFAAPKLGLLLQENAPFTGEVHILDIGLSPAFESATETRFQLATATLVKSRFRPRNRFAHKGNFGHAYLAAGSLGKMGAALMAATACLRGGAGLLSCHVPRCGVGILQTALPEAMALPDPDETRLTTLPGETSRYNCAGIGPGIGTSTQTAAMLRSCLAKFQVPFVLDADALNLLAKDESLMSLLPAGSILTPHPKEFDRLFGAHDSDFDRIETALAAAERLQSVVLLKGHHTFIASPTGSGYFNTTGNAGMAKGGSGDVLTGLLTALLAQGYGAEDAALVGVWLHGKAGDLAVERQSYESLLPGDLVARLGAAFRQLYP
ncbi:NAD(P)H-hydrate dehydratase [Flaviaesturariibacter flavus]|uniref:Bifunctional NAD(P)H-hydrate repair enzyme n=1 Tax=Flaviaesturariibacter flavus TaxID=2502780 RepID=A0A4V2NWX1_9BACT|nr:NAD(P)H-hydrate dehydratase [Flaviaesturariibacter flavus]TCJ19012.1 NAD(P)H-hydrate dehydratase [Flaviaesturariibacter flavus]